VIVLEQGAVCFRRNAPDEEIGVETGRRSHGKKIAFRDVHHHRRSAFGAEPCLDEMLEIEIDGQLHVCARLTFLPVELPNDPPGGIHLDASRAGTSAQQRFKPRLGTELADLELGDAQQRVGIRGPRQVIVADRADIADHMCQIGAAAVVARQTNLGCHARQGGGVHRHARHLVPAQPLGHRHGHEGTAPPDFGQRPCARLGIDRDDPREIVENLFDVAGLLAHDDHPVSLTILRQRDPVAIEEHSARGRKEAHVDPVLLGQQSVLVGLGDLELAHPSDQHRQRPGLKRTHHESAARHATRRFAGILAWPSHARRPPSEISLISAFLTPRRRLENSTTAG